MFRDNKMKRNTRTTLFAQILFDKKKEKLHGKFGPGCCTKFVLNRASYLGHRPIFLLVEFLLAWASLLGLLRDALRGHMQR